MLGPIIKDTEHMTTTRPIEKDTQHMTTTRPIEKDTQHMTRTRSASQKFNQKILKLL
jgi:hypothetical protein